jgi:hypothetical protein
MKQARQRALRRPESRSPAVIDYVDVHADADHGGDKGKVLDRAGVCLLLHSLHVVARRAYASNRPIYFWYHNVKTLYGVLRNRAKFDATRFFVVVTDHRAASGTT